MEGVVEGQRGFDMFMIPSRVYGLLVSMVCIGILESLSTQISIIEQVRVIRKTWEQL